MINRFKIFGDIFKLVPYFFRGKKTHGAVALFFMLLSGMMEAVNVAAIYPVINYGLGFEEHSVLVLYHYILNLIFSNESLFINSCYMLILITIISGISKYLSYYASYSLLRNLNRKLQYEIMQKLSTANYSFFINTQQGNLVHTSTLAVQQTMAFILHSVRLIGDTLTALVLLYLMFSLTYLASLGIITLGLIYLLVVRFFIVKVIHPSGQMSTDSARRSNVILNELITGIKSIKVFNSISNWAKKYFKQVDNYVDSQFKLLMGRAVPEISMRGLLFVIISFVGIFVYQKTNGEVLPLLPLYGTFALVALRLFPEVQKVSVDLMVLVESLPGTKIVNNFMRQAHSEKKPNHQISIDTFRDTIRFSNVSFIYDQSNLHGIPVLNNINLLLKKNQTTAIVGSSGSGKTTLTSLLVMLHDTYEGNISIDDKDIRKITKESYLNLIGYVSQETYIFNDTISENIKFGQDNISQEEIEMAAKKAYAHDFIMETEMQYNTVVGDMGAKLSGGQRQRIAIARAIVRKTPIIIFDEATSSLDNLSEQKVRNAINNLSNEKTVLIVTHKLSAIENVNKIYVLKDGKIVESGDHHSLIKNKSYYFKLYNSQDNE